MRAIGNPFLPIPAAAPSWRGSLTLGATVSAVALVAVLRRPDALLNPQFFGEEGAFFFAQQWVHGAKAFLMPYAGYFHFIPRLVAWLCDQFVGPRWAPTFYAYASLFFVIMTAAVVLDRRFPLRGGPLLALALVAAPHLQSEVLLTMTNTQWLTALALLATLCKSPPDPRFGPPWRQAAMDHAIVLVCGLTGPFSVLFLPLYAVRAWFERSAHGWRILSLLALTAAIHLMAVATRSPDHASGATPLTLLPQILGQRGFVGLFVPGGGQAWPAAAGLLAYLSVLALALTILRDRWSLALLLIGAHVLVIASTLYKAAGTWPHMTHMLYASRYFLIPHVIVLWILVDGALTQRGARRALALLLLLAAALTALGREWRAPPREDLDWAAWSQQIGQHAVTIPIHPRPWTIALPGAPWAR